MKDKQLEKIDNAFSNGIILGVIIGFTAGVIYQIFMGGYLR